MNHKMSKFISWAGYVLVLGVFALLWIAMIFLGSSKSIRYPMVYITVGIFLLIKKSNKEINLLQQIIAFFLFYIPVDSVANHFIEISGFGINISYSVPILAVCFIGCFMNYWGQYKNNSSLSQEERLYGNCWQAVMVIIFLFALFLFTLLRFYYGYGYERSLAVLGRVSMFYLLYLMLRNIFTLHRFRQCFAVLNILMSIFLCLAKFYA